jgi:hypothetical protein
MDYPKNQRIKTAYTPRSRVGKVGKYPRSYSDSANLLVFLQPRYVAQATP